MSRTGLTMYGVAPRSPRRKPADPRSWRVVAAAGLLGLALAAPARVQSATFEVNSTVDAVDEKPGDGVCASVAGECTLRAAVMEANARRGPDLIRLPKGRFDLSLSGRLEDASATGDLDILDDLDIAGSGPTATVIAGNGLDRVLHVVGSASTAVTLRLLAVTDGLAVGEAGEHGGGIRADKGSRLAMWDVAVVGNSSIAGGVGGGVYSSGELLMRDTTVSDNSSGYRGGGIYLDGGTLDLEWVSIVRNRAANGGGGIYAGFGASSRIVNTTVGDNEAIEGGGLMLFDVDEVGLWINNSTIARNRVLGGKGGGVWFAGVPPFASNSIVADNTLSGVGSDCAAPLASGGYNLDGDESCGFFASGDLPGLDPMLIDLGDYGGPTPTYPLRSGSPAVDRGRPLTPGIGDGACEAVDQRHSPRGRCDIGAFERGVCGDDVVDPGSGEQCEPGTVASGCCTESCVWKPAGTVCSDGEACTLGDQCRDGVCAPGLDSRVDSDGDGHYVIGGCLAPADDCDDGDGDVYGGASEICDGKDNDCNDLGDDGIPDVVSGSDIGACRRGIWRCQGGAFQVLRAEIGPSAEVCDALDNDCNGSDDDGIADRTVGTDVGECQSGLESCQDGGWDTVVAPVPPSAELCDRLDDDCDGVPDNGVTCFDDWSEDLELSGGLAYVAAGAAGLRVLQVDDVSGFIELWAWDPPECSDGGRDVPLYADDVELAGGYALISAGPCGVIVVDVDLEDPGFVAAFDTPGWTEDVAVADDGERGVAYVADHNGGLLEVDIAGVLRGEGATAPPQVLRSFGVGDAAFGAAIDLTLRGRLAYVATTTGLHIVDTGSEVEQLREMGAYRTDPASGLVPQDVELHPNPSVDIAYVAGWLGGLLVLDVSDPTAPELLQTIPSQWASYEVTIAGRILFLADGLTDLRLFDLANPADPSEILPAYPASGIVWDVATAAGTVYIAYGVQADPAAGGIEAVGSANLGLPAGAIDPVPEPAPWLLTAAAIACLVALRRRLVAEGPPARSRLR